MATINSVSSLAYIKSINGIVQPRINEIDKYTIDIHKYQLLYNNVISNLNTFLIYFSGGYYDLLTQNFTENIQNELTLKIKNNFNTDEINQLIYFSYDSANFEKTRKSYNNVLDGLKQTLKLCSINKHLTNENSVLQKDSDILNNPTLLKEYINNRNINVMPFQASETFNTTIEIKPWFLVYLIEIGAPKDGVFETEKLAEIVTRLINDGTITESEFINS
jgi:hypothetical protein